MSCITHPRGRVDHEERDRRQVLAPNVRVPRVPCAGRASRHGSVERARAGTSKTCSVVVDDNLIGVAVRVASALVLVDVRDDPAGSVLDPVLGHCMPLDHSEVAQMSRWCTARIHVIGRKAEQNPAWD